MEGEQYLGLDAAGMMLMFNGIMGITGAVFPLSTRQTPLIVDDR